MTIFLCLWAGALEANESIIETVLKTRTSLVTIKTIDSQIQASPQASAALDMKTGRMIIGRKMIQANLIKSAAGVIIHPSGLIVTNFHTLRGAQKFAVILHDQSSLQARVLHAMPKHDLVLLKIDPPYPLEPILFADSNLVKLGDAVINIGHSSLLKETVSGGVITGLGTSFLNNNPQEQAVEIIKVNINLYKGDSGGPLLDAQGRLIGMIAAKDRSKDKETFAIPSNKIKILYLDFIK